MQSKLFIIFAFMAYLKNISIFTGSSPTLSE